MGLTDEERRRLNEVAEQLERDDPKLSRALSDGAPTKLRRHDPDTPRQCGAPLPHTGEAIAATSGAVTGASLVVASFPIHQPALFAIGLGLGLAMPARHLLLRRHGRRHGGPGT